MNKLFQPTLSATILLSMFILSSGCVPTTSISIVPKDHKKITALDYTISNVKVLNNQIILTGTGLGNVTNFKIKESGVEKTLIIESSNATTIVANTVSNVSIGLNKVLDFILSNANATSTFTVNFSLCDGILGAKGFSCTTPINGQVLAYDSTDNKWVPKTITALHYEGTWNPTDVNYPPSRTTAGDYYVVSTSGTHAADSEVYTVGDWIVWNNTTLDYEKVSTSLVLSSGAVTSVFGRAGPAISAVKGDYHLNLLSDVDLTVAPQTNDVLQYNGSEWVAGTVTTTESDPTVKSFAKATLPTCTSGQFLKGDGTTLTCVTAGFSGTANKVVATDGTGALTVTAISDTVLGYLSGATSNIQTQLNAKASSASIVDWSSAGVTPTIDPSRLTLGVSNAGKAVITNGSGLITASATTSAQIGYLSGVTSDIQAQLNSKEGAYVGGNNLVTVTDGAGALSDSTISTTKLGYLSGVTSDIQTQLGTKQATISKTTTQDVSKLRIYGANTTNYVELSAGTLTGNRSIIFPDSDGTSGYILSTNGSGVLSWIAAPTATETDPTVKAFAKATLPTCSTGQYLKGDGTSLTCVTGSVFSGTANKVVATDSSGALVVTAISDTVLGYLSGVTSNVQTQLDAKANSASIVDWAASGVATIDPSRLNLLVANASKAVVTNASGFVVTSATTAAQLGYLSTATSDIQTQLNSKAAPYSGGNNLVTVTNGSGALSDSTISTTKLGYLSGVTSDIQTQLNAKAGAYSGGNNFVTVTNGSGALSDSTISTTKLGYLSGVTSDIQTQLGTKQATISKTTVQDVSKVRIYGANTTNYVELSAATLTGNRSIIFPDSDGTSGYVLSTNGSGTLSWIAIPSAPVGTVFGRTGTVVATAGDYTATQVTNTAAGNISSTTVQAAINELDTEKQNISTFAGDVRATVITGVSSATTTAIAATDTILDALGKLQGQLGNKQATITKTTVQDVSKIRLYGANSTNYVELTANTLTGNRTLTFPDSNGSSGYVLSTNGSGVLSWLALPTIPVATVFGRSGTVVSASGDYTASQITNVAAGDVAATTVQAAINELDTEKENISSLGSDIRAAVLTGISFATSTAITATDSILTSFGKLQAQITTGNSVSSNKLSKNTADSITAIITVSGAGDIIVPSTPAGMTSAVNKTYVDSNMVNNAGGAASMQIGTLAARPAAAAGNTGRMYVANDSGNEAVYVSTGSAWIKIAQNIASGTVAIANGGTGSTSFTGSKSVVVNSGATALVDGPSIDDTTAVAATLVKRGSGGEVYGQYMVPTTTVVENAACTVPVGTIAKDSAGNLLTCQ